MSANVIIYKNISQVLTLQGVAQKKGRHPTEADLGIIESASCAVDADNNVILWLGPSADLPKQYRDVEDVQLCEGSVWMPELVECHTHLIFSGQRHHDYALRAQGKTYAEVAAEGGGILSTIEETRKASPGTLLQKAIMDIDRFQRFGVGTLEIKSGYGLTLEHEIKTLECIRAIEDNAPLRILATFMPAHMTPPEFKGRTDEYVDVVCNEWIPKVAEAGLAVFFDVFVEQNYFSIEQARRLCLAAKEHGLQIKLHVDQFSDLGGTALAVELGAISCDHLDHVSDPNIAKIGGSDTVAVLLPGASLFTGTPYPPARKLIDAGARVALSTDYNPGTCPSRNLPLMTTIACSQMRMTLPEAIAAVTYNAAAALGVEDLAGTIETGKPFGVFQFEAASYEVFPYRFGEI